MKLGKEGIKTKFDEINIRVDFLIELCQSLQGQNKELIERVAVLEADLAKKLQTEEVHAEQEALIRTKIDGLLTKLDGFSANRREDDLSKA